jgi:hypothetical protein
MDAGTTLSSDLIRVTGTGVLNTKILLGNMSVIRASL